MLMMIFSGLCAPLYRLIMHHDSDWPLGNRQHLSQGGEADLSYYDWMRQRVELSLIL